MTDDNRITYDIAFTSREITVILNALEDYGIKLYKPIEEKRRITAKDLKPSEELQHIINKFVSAANESGNGVMPGNGQDKEKA